MYENILYLVVFETGPRVFISLHPAPLFVVTNKLYFVRLTDYTYVYGRFLWSDDLQISPLHNKNILVFNLVSISCSLL